MNTLDIIKYISFRRKNSSVLSIISLPVACKVVNEQKKYIYDVSDNILLRSMLRKYSFYQISKVYKCNIVTVFGEKTTGYWDKIPCDSEKQLLIAVQSLQEMRYENNDLRTLDYSKRFELLDLE